ncbi:L2 [Canis familiaris papillomavirus 18]|uniref:Minor capsid protein L2 n=1 Tax=Canis familiaris papillomavirus 18 TaxID=1816242 RepID=A0A3G1E4J2_9PAPI|nr:L2 [Canis familiaris papillomavirus 18]
MVRARRVKRASAEDLYRTCRANNTCPPDVINTYERKTVADKILQYGGAAIFLGGLGIGTAAGRGGAGGYTPLGGRVGSGVTVGTGTRAVRPPVPLDVLGAAEIAPVDALAPSVVPLQEGVPDIPLIDVNPGETPGIPSVPLEVPVDTSGSSFDAGPVRVVVHAVVEPIPSTPPVRTSTSWSLHSNPAFDVVPSSDNALGETSSASNIFVTHSNGGVSVGPSEEIPLRVFSTSTPKSTPPRPIGPRRGGYPQRFIEQVDVSDLDILERPGPRVQFEFDNPSFEGTLEFEPPPYPEVRAAPDPRFRDIVRLSSATYERIPSGHVRLSRLGVRGNVTTRSGVQLGSQAHFYHDISTLTVAEEIELTGLGEHSGTTVMVSGGAESAFEVIDLDSSSLSSLSLTSADLEAVLLGVEDVPNFENVRLEFPRGRNRVSLDLPTNNLVIPSTVDIGPGVVIDYPGEDSGGIYGPFGPVPPLIIVDVERGSGSDYYLHPSLTLRRRRRRRRKSL